MTRKSNFLTNKEKGLPYMVTCKQCKIRMESKHFVLARDKNNVCKQCIEKYDEKKHKQYKTNKLKKYGLTEEKYNQMFEEQNGCCAICRTHQSSLKRALSVDHCHAKGTIRGLLCNQCNISLGLMKENPIAIQNMIEYILVNLGDFNTLAPNLKNQKSD